MSKVFPEDKHAQIIEYNGIETSFKAVQKKSKLSKTEVFINLLAVHSQKFEFQTSRSCGCSQSFHSHMRKGL